MTVLITGPVRSGKSAFATALALERGGAVVFVATARLDPSDAEFAARVERHRRDRPAGWLTVETAGPPRVDLSRLIAENPPGTTLVVDSLGTWLADHLLDFERLAEDDAQSALARLEALADPLIDAVAVCRGAVLVVTEETGWGIVPSSALGRIFRDALGRVNARLARAADEAYLVVAGYALDLKQGRSAHWPGPPGPGPSPA